MSSSKSGMFLLLASNGNLMKITVNTNSLQYLLVIKTGIISQLSNIYDSHFNNNTLEGSVVNINEGDLTVGSSSFLSNQGNGLGSLIKAYNSTIIIQNTIVIGDLTADNVYLTKSGIFYVLESSLKLINCNITGGKGDSAGVLYSTASIIEIFGSFFNASTTNNAALYSSSDL